MGQAARRQVVQPRHAGLVWTGGPVRGDAAVRQTEGEYQQTPPIRQRQHGRCFGTGSVKAGAGPGHAMGREGVQGVAQADLAPVQHVVVGQGAAVDPGGAQQREVLRGHAVVDALGLRPAVAGHRAFQVDQAYLWLAALQLAEGVAPDVGEVHRSLDGTAALLGQHHVVAGVVHVVFVQPRIAGVRQDLVDATGRHDIAEEEQAERVFHAGHGCLPCGGKPAAGLRSGYLPRFTYRPARCRQGRLTVDEHSADAARSTRAGAAALRR
ncbi:hypothetical protein D3C81_1417720 [compost metagenome]